MTFVNLLAVWRSQVRAGFGRERFFGPEAAPAISSYLRAAKHQGATESSEWFRVRRAAASIAPQRHAPVGSPHASLRLRNPRDPNVFKGIAGVISGGPTEGALEHKCALCLHFVGEQGSVT